MKNRFLIAVAGGRVVVGNPPPRAMKRDEALNLAAWIVALVDPTEERFHELLEEASNKLDDEEEDS